MPGCSMFKFRFLAHSRIRTVCLDREAGITYEFAQPLLQPGRYGVDEDSKLHTPLEIDSA